MRPFTLLSLLNLLILVNCQASRSAQSSTASSFSSSASVISSVLFSSVPTSSVSQATSSSSSATSSSTSSVPSESPPATDADLEIIFGRRLSSIVGPLEGASNVALWLSSQSAEGVWLDVDYTAGCTARRANWPIQAHWQRLRTMAGAWHGGLPGTEDFVKSAPLLEGILKGMKWWFDRDFTANPACLDSGGTPLCPCTDTTLWNTNWFSNIILIPELVGQTCLLVKEMLPPVHLGRCIDMTSRSYGTFDRNINGVGFLTGANTLDVAQIGIDLSLLTLNTTITNDAYRRIHAEMVIQNAVKADGVRADGSFGQHGGIIYNGNYGKDYAIAILDLEIAAAGTRFAAGESARSAFATLFEGNKWMIYRNVKTNVPVLHWDFSVLNRFISFPVIDAQATGSIKLNLTSVQELGEKWNSPVLTRFSKSLSAPSSSANAGDLIGNKMFYANDYMVHRGSNYVSTLKMFSTRTLNTECVNSQNPLGFHLSDGTMYTYLRGNEYEDIAAAWDWNKVPGITTDSATPLTCSASQFTGVETFVGGVSNGKIGVAAMRYTNPVNKTLRWQKTWFFLPGDTLHVIVSNITVAADRSVISVLDQRRHAGTILIDGTKRKFSGLEGSRHQAASSLWHGDVGYAFEPCNSASLNVQVGEKLANWSTIGTSTQPPSNVNMFTAWLSHQVSDQAVAYTVFPGTTIEEFWEKKRNSRIQSIEVNGTISAVFDQRKAILMAVFWAVEGGVLDLPLSKSGILTRLQISTSGNIALIVNLLSGQVAVSDPSQKLSSVDVTFVVVFEVAAKPQRWPNDGLARTLRFALPSGGQAGSSVIENLYH